MYDNDSKGISFTAGFFMLLAFAIAGMYLANEINAQVWKAMTGKSYAQFLTGMADPANARVYQITQCINAVIGFFFPTLIVASLLHRKPMKLLDFSSNVTAQQVVLVFFITAAAVFVGGALSYLNYQIPLPRKPVLIKWRQTTINRWRLYYNLKIAVIISLLLS